MRLDLDCHPDWLVSNNRRIHWARRAEVHRYWRTRVHYALVAADDCQPIDQAVVTATFRFPDRRRRDTPNLTDHVVKPCVDGMVDAGLLVDDDDRHVVELRVRRDLERGPLRLTLTVEDAVFDRAVVEDVR